MIAYRIWQRVVGARGVPAAGAPAVGFNESRFATTRAMCVGGVAALVLSACITSGKGSALNAEDRAKLAGFVVDTVPERARKVDINFEGKARIVAVLVEPELAPPGTSVTVTSYWRLDNTLEDGWSLFTHGKDEASGQFENLDGSGPLREARGGAQLFGPSRWEKGKIYADAVTVVVPDYGAGMGPEFALKTGVWRGNTRLKVTAGPSDGENGAVVARIKTGREPKKGGDVPALTVAKLPAGSRISVDGKDDEAAWAKAAVTDAFVNVATGKPDSSAAVGGTAKLTYDDENLYVFFSTRNTNLRGGYSNPKSAPTLFTTTGQPKLWERDTVEIMLDPDGDGDNLDYYELQVNPENKVFHTQYDSYNAPKTDPHGPFGHEDWDPKLKSAVVLRGTLDDDKSDEGYCVEVAIAWKSFSKAKHAPPAAGDAWRMNFYAMKDNGGVGWSPILNQGNFHKASRFGRVVWADADGHVPPSANPEVARPHGVVKLPE